MTYEYMGDVTQSIVRAPVTSFRGRSRPSLVGGRLHDLSSLPLLRPQPQRP